MSATIEMIENLIKDGFTVTIAPAQGLDYFEQPTVLEYLVTTSKDGVVYGEGSQPTLAEALEDAYMLTPQADTIDLELEFSHWVDWDVEESESAG